MRIEVMKFKSGERYPMLLGDDGVPDFWVTHYVTQNLRNDKASTTIVQYLKSFIHFKKWERMNDRSILDEIYSGKIPNSDEIKKIKEHCNFQSKALLEKKIGKVTDMSQFHLSKSMDKPTVSKNHFNTRIAHIADFLSFIGQERVKHKPTAAKLTDELKKMEKEFKKNKPKRTLKKSSVDKSGIPDDVFEDFIEVARPGSLYNPFKNMDIQFRNYIILQVFYETGFRCSELLALRIGDIGSEIDNPTLTIERRHDSKDDPRPREPTAKTLGRTVRISSELRSLLHFYIKNQRAQTETSISHPFIFVSHKSKKGSYESGKPIVQQTINDIFNFIKKVNPERFWGVTPHLFRHYFNQLVSAQIDSQKEIVLKEVERLERSGIPETAKLYSRENMITEQQELEIRAYLNGHSSLDSGRFYLDRTIRMRAKKISEAVHEKLKQTINGVNRGQYNTK